MSDLYLMLITAVSSFFFFLIAEPIGLWLMRVFG